MRAPTLTAEQVAAGMPQLSNVSFLANGGQKAVFIATLQGSQYIFKFLTPGAERSVDVDNDLDNGEPSDAVAARAEREVNTMNQCRSPHLVKLGPLPLQECRIADQDLLVFSEEYIDGETLDVYRNRVGNWAVAEVVRLGNEMAEAISVLWSVRKIHRDIKPNNIMRHTADGSFTLLDMGLVFDLDAESHSVCPVGTPLFFSPEQLDFVNRRRVLDFRSDLFSLGVVMYMMLTNQHPFLRAGDTTHDVLRRVLHESVRPPIQLRPEIPTTLNEILVRLLAKQPNRRYRSVERFTQALSCVDSRGD